MINNVNSIVCTNIYSILNELNMFNKLPEDKQKYIMKHKENYIVKFNKNVPIQFQINDKETMVILSYLFIKYINDSADTKKYLLDKYKKNEIEYQKELRKKYNPDNIFKNTGRQDNTNSTIVNKEVALVEIKENVISRIIKKIKNFFIKGTN